MRAYGTIGGMSPSASPDHRALSLPEELLLLVHGESGMLCEIEQAELCCAAAELGELALLERVEIVSQGRKRRLLGFDVYSMRGTVRVLDSAPAGPHWADTVLAGLWGLSPEGQRLELGHWLRHRGEEAPLDTHRHELVGRGLLYYQSLGSSRPREQYFPEPSAHRAVVHRVRSALAEETALDAPTLLLMDLVQEGGLFPRLGLRMTGRQRLRYARGVGAVAAVPEALRDASVLLSSAVRSQLHSQRSGTGGGGGGGDGGDGGDGGGGE